MVVGAGLDNLVAAAKVVVVGVGLDNLVAAAKVVVGEVEEVEEVGLNMKEEL